MTGETPLAADEALRHVTGLARAGTPVAAGVRVSVNFHPDRGGMLEALGREGVYRSQFVTGTSNGGLTAYPGGDRWRWESRIFGGAYDRADGRARPVYGALNFRRERVGAAPRFGSAHFRLRAGTLARATFCYPDSAREPSDFGVEGTVSALVELARADTAAGRGDALDGYVEAQVHGPVVLAEDVEALVLDPSHRGTAVEDAARLLPCPLEWHAGFRLAVTELRRHPDYRGPEFVALGAEIAEGGFLDPRVIGDAARTGRHDPQSLKRVWHCVARFGAPSEGQAVVVGEVGEVGRR
ncbi:DUF3626 domain-containing protein [Streptomyces sp. NPDC087422]|uniref:DUF3626 domain-containing protein n=1 Tax=Streptomyces sp. NPDC087422 TaxID=3365786 RepID=UPI00381F1A72